MSKSWPPEGGLSKPGLYSLGEFFEIIVETCNPGLCSAIIRIRKSLSEIEYLEAQAILRDFVGDLS